MVFWVSHSVNNCIQIKYNNFLSSHVVVKVSFVRQSTTLLPGSSPNVPWGERDWGQVGENPGNKVDLEQWSHCLHVWALAIQQKFQFKISETKGPVEQTFRLHRTDSSHCAFVIVLVSRIQKSGTGSNNYVQ